MPKSPLHFILPKVQSRFLAESVLTIVAHQIQKVRTGRRQAYKQGCKHNTENYCKSGCSNAAYKASGRRAHLACRQLFPGHVPKHDFNGTGNDGPNGAMHITIPRMPQTIAPAPKSLGRVIRYLLVLRLLILHLVRLLHLLTSFFVPQ
jgi:hypothetical protein